MNRSFLLLPLTALVLTACTTNTPAPVVNADGTDLSPGVMQPAGGSYGSNAGWQSDIQTTSMPTTMQTPTYSVPQPQPVYSAPQSQPQPVATKPTTAAKKPVSQDFTIPRDEKNLPIYSQIDKGFYDGETYTVRKGDTMFLIAYIAGKDVKEIAALNNMTEPYQLSIGQKIKLNDGTSSTQQTIAQAPQAAPSKPVEPAVTYTQAPNGTAYGSDGTVTGPVKAGVGSVATGVVVNPTPTVISTNEPVTAKAPAVAVPNSSIAWQWPAQGRVISSFSAAEGGNKGIDIAGAKGQPVKAAAAGRVVYAGNALQGYGNLIIIKHNDDFLSAYAHNDSIKVDEQDTVKAGQTIATLGSTGTNSNKLHFEIRYQGKSVDPTRYLPRQ